MILRVANVEWGEDTETLSFDVLAEDGSSVVFQFHVSKDHGATETELYVEAGKRVEWRWGPGGFPGGPKDEGGPPLPTSRSGIPR